MSNVVLFPTKFSPAKNRKVSPITLDEFVAADEARNWTSRHFVNGLTMLQMPMGILICDADAKCTAISYTGTEIECHLAEAIAAIG